MIILDATNKSLEFLLGGAVTTNQLPFVSTYVDVTTTTYTPGSSDGLSNNTTAVTLAAAPAASTQRQVKFVSIRNSDTVNAVVTVRYVNGANTRIIVTITLGVGSTLLYTDGEGWRVITSAGIALIGSISNVAGAEGYIQYNKSGIFGAEAEFSYDDVNDRLSATKARATEFEIRDSDLSHVLRLLTSSNLTANRALTLIPGDADRNITLSGNPTLADWFDQSVKVAASPTHVKLTLSNGQITFPVTQVPAGNANTLDDFEYGNWTPVIGGATSTSGQTYNSQVAKYIKIGKAVITSGYVSLTNMGTIVGNIQIQGFPFPSENTAGVYTSISISHFESLAIAKSFVGGFIPPNTTHATIIGLAAAAVSVANLVPADIGNTSGFIFSAFYSAAT